MKCVTTHPTRFLGSRFRRQGTGGRGERTASPSLRRPTLRSQFSLPLLRFVEFVARYVWRRAENVLDGGAHAARSVAIMARAAAPLGMRCNGLGTSDDVRAGGWSPVRCHIGELLLVCPGDQGLSRGLVALLLHPIPVDLSGGRHLGWVSLGPFAILRPARPLLMHAAHLVREAARFCLERHRARRIRRASARRPRFRRRAGASDAAASLMSPPPSLWHGWARGCTLRYAFMKRRGAANGSVIVQCPTGGLCRTRLASVPPGRRRLLAAA